MMPWDAMGCNVMSGDAMQHCSTAAAAAPSCRPVQQGGSAAAKQSTAEQNRAEQSKAEQNKAKQCRAEQSRTKQSKIGRAHV